MNIIEMKKIDLHAHLNGTVSTQIFIELCNKFDIDIPNGIDLNSDLQVLNKVGSLIKFHGDFNDDTSIVLTESSYFERLNFEGPLDIKLRSDILGKSILFIGYSLNDINIKYLLYKVNKLWEKSPHSSLQPKSYVFLHKPNPIKEKILESRGIQTISSNEDNPKEALTTFLRKLLKNVN